MSDSSRVGALPCSPSSTTMHAPNSSHNDASYRDIQASDVPLRQVAGAASADHPIHSTYKDGAAGGRGSWQDKNKYFLETDIADHEPTEEGLESSNAHFATSQGSDTATIWQKGFLDTIVRAEEVTERDKVYTFLVSRSATVPTLRTLYKRHELKQIGNKREMALRLTVRFWRAEREDEHFGWGVAAEPDEQSTKFKDWCVHPTQATEQRWRQCPTEEALLQTMPTNLKDRGVLGGPALSASTAAPFTLDEFARLVGVLYGIEECTRALLRSGNRLVRSEIDRRASSNDFWDSVVAKYFNDEAVRPTVNLDGVVSGTDPTIPPPIKRTGDKLRQKFAKVRALLTVALDKWRRSGQNDPDPIAFETFVPRAPNSFEISADGKRAVILFMALKCDQGDQDDNAALQFTLKLAYPGIGYDEGSSNGSIIRTPRGRKRSPPSDSDDLDGIMSNMADSIGTFVKDGASDMAKAIRSMYGNRAIAEETLEERLISRRETLLKKLTTVCKEINTVKNEAPDMLRFYERQRDAVVAEIEKIDIIDMGDRDLV